MDERIYGLLGRKLGHSWSVPIHAALGNGAYRLLELEPDGLAPFLHRKDIGGLNVTIPYKALALALCDEVSERYDAICAQNGWQLQLELPDEELPVYADPNMMQRALHNLLGNAMHHIGGDGIFLLRASKVPEGVRVEIEDHGPGICAEDLPYIFDRYYRSRSDAGKQGTGLGLSITKAIFQQHGFRFGVQSTLGKGTTFWFIATDTK